MATSASAVLELRPRARSETPRALLRAVHATGDPHARERLVEHYLPLVRALARRYAGRGEALEDLVQVGSIGLIEAIDRFDPDRTDDFTRFAIPTITGEIRHHLRDRTGSVRVPRRLAELTTALQAPRERLTLRLARRPTALELAREAGVPESDVVDAARTELARAPVSLALVESDSEPDRAIAVDGTYECSDDRMLLAAGFRTLPRRERRILHLRYFAGLSQDEIAREVGLSQVQVSRLIRSSLQRLRPLLDVEPTGSRL